jgi:hypothetical protein
MKKPLVVWGAATGVLLAAGVAVGLTLTNPADNTAVQPAPAVAAPAPTTAIKCPDFSAADYIGQPATVGNTAKSLGWYVEFVNPKAAGVKIANPVGLRITGFDKNQFGCSVLFKVSAPEQTVQPVTSAAPAAPVTTLSDGVYLVGTDIEAGSYKSPGGYGCYWARMKDDAGDRIIANDLTDGPARFTAKKGEYVKVARCTFTKV